MELTVLLVLKIDPMQDPRFVSTVLLSMFFNKNVDLPFVAEILYVPAAIISPVVELFSI